MLKKPSKINWFALKKKNISNKLLEDFFKAIKIEKKINFNLLKIFYSLFRIVSGRMNASNTGVMQMF